MSSPPLRRLAIVLIAVSAALWAIGPRWPGNYDRLLCGESWSVREIFPDRPACEVAMAAAREECVCEDVRGSWPPLYYLVLIPLVLIHGLLFLMPRVIVGTIAVLGVVMIAVTFVPYLVFVMYGMGLRIPLLLQQMAIIWPQQVLFPAVLETRRGKVIPYEMSNWVFAVSIFMWAALGMMFGAMIQRLRSPRLIIGLAVAFVATITIGLYKLAPSLGWKYLFETP